MLHIYTHTVKTWQLVVVNFETKQVPTLVHFHRHHPIPDSYWIQPDLPLNCS